MIANKLLTHHCLSRCVLQWKGCLGGSLLVGYTVGGLWKPWLLFSPFPVTWIGLLSLVVGTSPEGGRNWIQRLTVIFMENREPVAVWDYLIIIISTWIHQKVVCFDVKKGSCIVQHDFDSWIPRLIYLTSRFSSLSVRKIQPRRCSCFLWKQRIWARILHLANCPQVLLIQINN